MATFRNLFGWLARAPSRVLGGNRSAGGGSAPLGPDAESQSSEPEHVPVRPSAYWIVIAFYAAAVIATAVFFPELFYWVLAVAVLHFALSWRIVGAEYRGGIFVLGIAAMEVRSGPKFVLAGLMSLQQVREYPPQRQIPAEPDLVYHGHDNTGLPAHPIGRPMVRPIRLLTGKPRGDYPGVLNIQMTTKVTGTIRYRIIHFFDFWIRMAGVTAEDKIEEANKQLFDTWLSAVKEEWTDRPVGLIIDEIDEIEYFVREAVHKEGKTRGIATYEVTLQPPDVDHAMSAQLSRIGEVRAEKEQTQTRSEGEAYEIRQKAGADADAHKMKEMADADADAYRVKKMRITGREMFAADTAARVLGDKDKVIFGASGLTEAIGAGYTIIDAMNSQSRSKPADQKPEEQSTEEGTADV